MSVAVEFFEVDGVPWVRRTVKNGEAPGPIIERPATEADKLEFAAISDSGAQPAVAKRIKR
jgi:hypothetical protein